MEININAVYYSFSRMFLPTLTILVFLFVITLDFTVLINFLKSGTPIAIFVRVIIFLAEIAWFLFLYEKGLKKIKLKENIKLSIEEIKFITELKDLKSKVMYKSVDRYDIHRDLKATSKYTLIKDSKDFEKHIIIPTEQFENYLKLEKELC